MLLPSSRLFIRRGLLSLANYLLLIPCFAQLFPIPDDPYPQPTATFFDLPAGIPSTSLQEVLVDVYDIVYVRTDEGLFRLMEEQLVPAKLYRPLANLNPVDICTQENSGYLYYLYEDRWLTNAYAGVPYALLPEGTFESIAAAEDGRVLVVGEKSAALWQRDRWQTLPIPPGKQLDLVVHEGHFFVLTSKAVYQLVGEKWLTIHTSQQALSSMAFRGSELILGTEQGYYGWDWRKNSHSFPLQVSVPVPSINQLLVVKDQIWAGSAQGAYVRKPEGGYRYFASRRWLPADSVLDMAVDSEGSLYVLTASGLGKIAFPAYELAQKTALFERNIRQYHLRYGFIANLRLTEPGKLTSAEMIDTDNDGLWTSFWLGSQAFRYATTGSEQARQHVWESFAAFERLLSVNQLQGFPSRTFERKDFKVSDPIRWRNSPDPAWEWKGHTSSDEFVAYLFVVSVMDQLVAKTEGEKQRLADFFDAIMTHILENDWALVDIDDKPTLWGRWSPEFVNGYAPTVFDRRLNSSNLLAGLQLAYGLTGKETYRKAAYEVLDQHGFRDNLKIKMKDFRYTEHRYGKILMGTDWNHSDDEMAFLLYWPLYHYALDPELKNIYAEMIRDHWEIELPERNALWNLIAYGTIGTIDAPSTRWHLQEFPLDLIRYNMKNSHRKDLTFLPENFRRQSTTELLSPAERPMHRHNANPFQLDGGQGGTTKLAGDEYLLPYWMSRYLKVIGP